MKKTEKPAAPALSFSLSMLLKKKIKILFETELPLLEVFVRQPLKNKPDLMP